MRKLEAIKNYVRYKRVPLFVRERVVDFYEYASLGGLPATGPAGGLPTTGPQGSPWDPNGSPPAHASQVPLLAHSAG